MAGQATFAADGTAARPGRQLVFHDGSSNKFWNIELSDNSHTVRFGRIGTQGQQQTKQFDNAAQACKSYDKLVAEKLKKGYVDAGGPASAATGATPAPVKAVKPKGKAEAGAAEEAAAAIPAVAPAVSVNTVRRIDLEPTDWYRATFRPHVMLARGEARPFDQAACLETLARLRTECYGWDIRWRDLRLPLALSREEAHFWLTAMTTPRLERSLANSKQLAEQLAGDTFTGQVDTAEVGGCIARLERGMPDGLLLVVAALLPLDGLIDLLLSGPKRHVGWRRRGSTAELIEGFHRYVLPYLSSDEIDAARKIVRKGFDPDKSSNDFYNGLLPEYYLAAMLGMHAEVYAVTSSWCDDRYGKEEWSDHYQRPQALVFGLGTPELVAAEWRRLRLRMRSAEDVRGFLACTEYGALECVRDSILAETNKERAEALLKAFALVHAPEAAEPMLECKLGSKMPAIARDWLDENVGCAVAGLLGTLARRGKLADAAIDYLRGTQRRGCGQVIVDFLEQVTDDELRARVISDVIDYREKVYTPWDARTTPPWLASALAESIQRKSAGLPAWCTPALLPPLTLGDSRLNDEQMQWVLRAIAATPVGQPNPLLTAVREHVPAHVRDEFAWKLFSEWMSGGAASKEKWAMGAIGHLGGDGCALRLTPLVRAWPGESQHARAVFGLECLRAIGSDVALMQLSGVAQKLKFKGLKATAEKFVNEIAAERGMTRAELEDRVVPDCGLDEQGRREFSFGARAFSFVLGSDLKAMVRDPDGKLRGDLPKPSGKDDAAVAEQSLAEWKLLKKQIKEVAAIQAGRLEQAMVTGRRWRVADFETLLVRHPLMTHLVRQLLWGAFDATGRRVAVFRVTEERDYADANDDTLALDAAETVGVLHALDLNETERAAWGQVLGDYEIIAPFPQLGRAVYSLESDEATLDDLTRYHGLTLVAPTLVFTLEKLGWIRGVAMDAGSFDEHSKQFPAADVTAVVIYDGVVGMGYIDPNELLTISHCQFVQGMRKPSGYGWDKDEVLKLGDVPPIVVSEVMADMQMLKSKAK